MQIVKPNVDPLRNTLVANVDALHKTLVGNSEGDDCCKPLFSHMSVHVCDTVSNIQLNLA